MREDVAHQHYVPACYLANFGIEGNQKRNSKIYFYNIKDKKTGISKVSKMPVEKYFYDIEALGDDKQLLENFFTQIEGDLAGLLQTIIQSVVIDPNLRDSNYLYLTNEKRALLSCQIALQITRTYSFRNYFNDIYLQLKNGFPYADIPSYSKEDIKRIHIVELFENKFSNFYSNFIDDRHLIVLVNHTDVPFITSDKPIVNIDYRKNQQYPTSIIDKEVTLFFPISPYIAIEVYDKNIARKDLAYLDIYKEKNVIGYNLALINEDTRFLFSNKSFDLMKQMRKTIYDQT